MSKSSFLRNVTAASLSAVVFVTSSMLALAAPGKTQMGELTIMGAAAVSVNGESAQTGRTVFSSNTITTPANASAIINLGKNGQVELAPNSSMSLNFNENSISGNLLSGRVKVSGANDVAANINTATASVVADSNQAKVFTVSLDGAKTNVASEVGTATLNEGGKAVKVGKQQSDDDDGGFFTGNAIIYAIVFGVAAATIIYVAADDSNDLTFSGSGTVVSPTR